jgi:integrase
MPKKALKPQPLEVPPSLLRDFMDKYSRGTSYVYRSGLLDFFDFINGTRIRGREATKGDMIKYEELAAGFIREKRNHAADLVRYTKHLREIGVPPKTAHVRIVAVKEFLSRNGFELDKIAEKDVRRLQPKGGKRTDFEYIDRKILAEILHHVDSRGKALILVLASSGMRIGEALNLNWLDVKCPDRKDYPNKPASAFIRDSKTGHSRTVFISREAEAALREWKKEYNAYLDWATKQSHNLGPTKVKHDNGNKVFPFGITSTHALWDNALEASGYLNHDDQTKRVKMNIHRLRNFFSVQVASVAGQQVSEVLLGHTDRYGGAYSGQSLAGLEEAYLKAEPVLTIGATSMEIEKHTTEIAALKRENEELKARLDKTANGGEVEGLKEEVRMLHDSLQYVMANLPTDFRKKWDKEVEHGREITQNLTVKGKKVCLQ